MTIGSQWRGHVGQMMNWHLYAEFFPLSYQEGLLQNLKQGGQLRRGYEQVRRETIGGVIVPIKHGCLMGRQIIWPLLEC